MKKLITNQILILLILIIGLGCSNSDNLKSCSIDLGEKSASFQCGNESIDLSGPEEFLFDRDVLQNIGIDVFFNHHSSLSPYEDPDIDVSNPDVFRELIVSNDGTFSIKIENCLVSEDWFFKNDDTYISLDNMYTETVSEDRYDQYFEFSFTRHTKGYLYFTETINGFTTGLSKGFIVGYNTHPDEDLWVEFDNVIWNYDVGDFSYVSVHLTGTTNADRIRIIQSGYGEIGIQEINVDESGYFDQKVGIAASHEDHVYLTTDTQIALFGQCLVPPTMDLKNPK